MAWGDTLIWCGLIYVCDIFVHLWLHWLLVFKYTHTSHTHTRSWSQNKILLLLFKPLFLLLLSLINMHNIGFFATTQTYWGVFVIPHIYEMNKQNANVAIHRWVYHIIENNSNKCVRLLLILYELENDICVMLL